MYVSNKMECFTYKGGCGMHGHTHIKVFERRVAWATDKRLQAISNIMLFKTVMPLRN